MNGRGLFWLGRKHTEESKLKMSNAQLGRKNHFYGKKHTDESKAKNRESHIGENNPFFGKKHTKESRDKMRASHPGRTGENAPNWQGGLSFKPYGSEFNKKLKEQIRNRDNRTCQECGKTLDELAIHHIDYDKKNNDETNLITLCRSCHSKTNTNREDWIEYFGKKTGVA